MRIVLAASVAIGLCAGVLAAPAAPVSEAAEPDFSGFWVRTGNLWFDPVLDDETVGRPIDRLPVGGPDADEIYAGDFDNPILQPWAREIVKRNAESEIALRHVYTADDSCWPSGVPQAVNLIGEVQFLQAKDRVIILYQRDHQVRWIWLNQSHSPNPKPSWYGESVGHYEGDTLVVDTIAQKTHKMSVVDAFGTPHTDKIHVVERYRLFENPLGKGIEVTVWVDDPGAFTRPFKGTAIYRQNPGADRFLEIACAENNRSFADGSTFGTIPEEKVPPF